MADEEKPKPAATADPKKAAEAIRAAEKNFNQALAAGTAAGLTVELDARPVADPGGPQPTRPNVVASIKQVTEL